MRRAIDKAVLAGAVVIVVASMLVPWAWGEAKKALTQ